MCLAHALRHRHLAIAGYAVTCGLHVHLLGFISDNCLHVCDYDYDETIRRQSEGYT